MLCCNCYYLLNYKNYCYNLNYYKFILYYYNIVIPEEFEPLFNFASSVFFMLLISLSCLINLSIYLISIYLVNKYNDNINDKFKNYPFFIKILNFYKSTRILFISLEIIICLFCIIVILIYSLFILGIPIFKINYN